MLQLIVIQKDMFIISFFIGVAMGFSYDILRCLRRLLLHNIFFISVEDIAFWVIWALIIVSKIHEYNSGEFRVYVFVGVFIGTLIYLLTVSKVFMYIMSYILCFFGNIVKKIKKLLKKSTRHVKM